MPTNLSNLIVAGGNIKAASLALSGTTSAVLNIPGSNFTLRVPFNAVTDPYSLCTVNQSLSTFTLIPGAYSFEIYQGACYMTNFGGNFGALYRLTVGSYVQEYKRNLPNNNEMDWSIVGVPVFQNLTTTTTCSLDFAQPRGPGTFNPPGTSSNQTAPGFYEWFKLNIYKVR